MGETAIIVIVALSVVLNVVTMLLNVRAMVIRRRASKESVTATGDPVN